MTAHESSNPEPSTANLLTINMEPRHSNLSHRKISQKVFIKTFCKGQCPHKSVNSFLILVIIKDKLTDLCGNRPLQSDLIDTFCEIRTQNSDDRERGRGGGEGAGQEGEVLARDVVLRQREYLQMLGCYVTKSAPHKALKSIAWDKMTFDVRVVLHRVDSRKVRCALGMLFCASESTCPHDEV